VRVRTAERIALPGQDPALRWLQFTVEDNGRGMDEATRTRMFEPFLRGTKGPKYADSVSPSSMASCGRTAASSTCRARWGAAPA